MAVFGFAQELALLSGAELPLEHPDCFVVKRLGSGVRVLPVSVHDPI
jgi:hypothetical protein